MSEKEEIIERRLNWVSMVSTPEQLREEIMRLLRAPPSVCADVDVSVGEPLGGELIFERHGVVIKQYALIIAEIRCNNERYEAQFRGHVIETGNVRIFFDIDLRYLSKIPT